MRRRSRHSFAAAAGEPRTAASLVKRLHGRRGGTVLHVASQCCDETCNVLTQLGAGLVCCRVMAIARTSIEVSILGHCSSAYAEIVFHVSSCCQESEPTETLWIFNTWLLVS